ncbi:serine/threonine protein phosphatase 1 [Paenibacillus cellulosilyticus]|uniref:Serine/threonine protein phosphatase 1 n=1 Tax=Paenibacillus cellulosilyticus TaxID=375489 RepID=A0A2V2YZH7_9BACL|nr:metallophosphoesterase [Paenibacillus cellulosilyticus]PWV99314.1 serine/threonine protein phosphatase 1 [Paenibacillus cellulosilyticus]QKS45079.1 serine/threonine protein phosphatase [Paenibacillus cellulosilyticus]
MIVNRTLVISDIHGCYREFVELLERMEYNPINDRLILLGDYVSRGPCSREVVQLVMILVEEHGAIALQGNHDHRFVRVMENEATEKETARFFDFGGLETLRSYCNNDITINQEHLDEIRSYMGQFESHIAFLKGLPYYYEDRDYIYVHAGVNPNGGPLSEQDLQDLLYIKEAFYNHKTNLEKVVIFGHTITPDIHGVPDIWEGEDKIGIDGGCAFGYQLNGLVLKDGRLNETYYIKADSCSFKANRSTYSRTMKAST